MDWIRDKAGISERDLAVVFKYEPKASTVFRKVESDEEPVISSLDTDEKWEHWLKNELPSPMENESGLVLVIARRTGEPPLKTIQRTNTDEWLSVLQEHAPGKPQNRALSSDLEKLSPVSTGLSSTHSKVPTGRRSLRTLPFSESTFRRIAEDFHIHGSIARTISRADVPVFSAANVHMGKAAHPAIVYTSRSSNDWELDLALAVTFFPHCGLTYAILFGCPLSVETEVIRRLRSASDDVHHPLLMPGIFTEIERARHIKLVEKTIDELESKIMDLDSQSSQAMNVNRTEVEKQNQDKRSSWLDTTYLRNNLITWSTQLKKMANHEKELSCGLFRQRAQSGSMKKSSYHREEFLSQRGHSDSDDALSVMDASDDIHYFEAETFSSGYATNHEEDARRRFRMTGRKIRNRLKAIIDEYDDKIRDCTMRVDGMAMATQWATGETNVEIALATSRDSQHMRSIALITMLFLPGTFLASFFSMTFFDWFGENSTGSYVSSSIWIYVVVTVLVTLLTVGSWYYWVIWGSSRLRQEVTTVPDRPLHAKTRLRRWRSRLFSRRPQRYLEEDGRF